jgi:hypothetical protein
MFCKIHACDVYKFFYCVVKRRLLVTNTLRILIISRGLRKHMNNRLKTRNNTPSFLSAVLLFYTGICHKATVLSRNIDGRDLYEGFLLFFETQIPTHGNDRCFERNYV